MSKVVQTFSLGTESPRCPSIGLWSGRLFGMDAADDTAKITSGEPIRVRRWFASRRSTSCYDGYHRQHRESRFTTKPPPDPLIPR